MGDGMTTGEQASEEALVFEYREEDLVVFAVHKLRLTSDDKFPAYALRAPGTAEQAEGVLIQDHGMGSWVYRAISTAPRFNDRRWRREVRATGELEAVAHSAYQHLLGLIAALRFDDPTVLGDPAEARLPVLGRNKLLLLREKVQDLDAQLAAERAARPVNPLVTYQLPGGLVKVYVDDNGELVVSAVDGLMRITPMWRGRINVVVEPLP